MAEFLTPTGVTGPLTAAMVAAARCFVQPQYKLPSLLRAVLRDEYITWHKKVSERHKNVFSHLSDDVGFLMYPTDWLPGNVDDELAFSGYPPPFP